MHEIITVNLAPLAPFAALAVPEWGATVRRLPRAKLETRARAVRGAIALLGDGLLVLLPSRVASKSAGADHTEPASFAAAVGTLAALMRRAEEHAARGRLGVFAADGDKDGGGSGPDAVVAAMRELHAAALAERREAEAAMAADEDDVDAVGTVPMEDAGGATAAAGDNGDAAMPFAGSAALGGDDGVHRPVYASLEDLCDEALVFALQEAEAVVADAAAAAVAGGGTTAMEADGAAPPVTPGARRRAASFGGGGGSGAVTSGGEHACEYVLLNLLLAPEVPVGCRGGVEIPRIIYHGRRRAVVPKSPHLTKPNSDSWQNVGDYRFKRLAKCM